MESQFGYFMMTTPHHIFTHLMVSISPISIIKGKVPNRVKSMVIEWAALHQQELMDNWQQCQSGKSPKKLEPLD
jgi:hypothetical protein